MRIAAVFWVLLFNAVASAGGYGTVRLSADAAGVVRLRGPNVQGVDWHAAGRSTADVPVYVYGDDGGPLTVNDRPSDAAVRPDAAAQDARPAFDEDVYQQAAIWSPAPTAAVERWTLGAVGVVGLTLFVARAADRKRATRWTVVAAIVLTGGVAGLFPADAPRRTLGVPGQAGVEWVWYAGRGAGPVEEPWAAGLRFVPRSTGRLREAGPVLHCDAAGRPVALRCRVGAGGRAVFLRERRTADAGPVAIQ